MSISQEIEPTSFSVEETKSSKRIKNWFHTDTLEAGEVPKLRFFPIWYVPIGVMYWRNVIKKSQIERKNSIRLSPGVSTTNPSHVAGFLFVIFIYDIC
jgi:hypothetical protein